MCELVIGDSTVLSIERRPEAGTLLMTSVVADALPDPVDYALVLDMLDFSLGETSKIGLDFFRSRGTPVMFQFSDYMGDNSTVQFVGGL